MNEQGQSKRQQFTSSSENTTETSHSTHAELNSCQFQDDESLLSPNLPQDLRELQDLLGDFDPITDLNPDDIENLDHNDATQSVPIYPQEDGHNHPTPRGRDGESLPSPNLPQDLSEFQDLLGDFDPITDLESLGVDHTDGQENPENTENMEPNDTTQGVPIFQQKSCQNYHEVFPFQAPESLTQPIC